MLQASPAWPMKWTEVLEVKAAEFYVKQYRRPKYARKDDKGIAIGELPSRAIDKGIAGASVY